MGENTSERSQLATRVALQVFGGLVGIIAGFGACVALVGGLQSWVRLATAGLPADSVMGTLEMRSLIGAGLRTLAIVPLVIVAAVLVAELRSHAGRDFERTVERIRRWAFALFYFYVAVVLAFTLMLLLLALANLLGPIGLGLLLIAVGLFPELSRVCGRGKADVVSGERQTLSPRESPPWLFSWPERFLKARAARSALAIGSAATAATAGALFEWRPAAGIVVLVVLFLLALFATLGGTAWYWRMFELLPDLAALAPLKRPRWYRHLIVIGCLGTAVGMLALPLWLGVFMLSAFMLALLARAIALLPRAADKPWSGMVKVCVRVMRDR